MYDQEKELNAYDFEGDHDSVSLREVEAEARKRLAEKMRFDAVKREAHELGIPLPQYLLWRILGAADCIKKEMHEIESRLESMDADQRPIS